MIHFGSMRPVTARPQMRKPPISAESGFVTPTPLNAPRFGADNTGDIWSRILRFTPEQLTAFRQSLSEGIAFHTEKTLNNPGLERKNLNESRMGLAKVVKHLTESLEGGVVSCVTTTNSLLQEESIIQLSNGEAYSVILSSEASNASHFILRSLNKEKPLVLDSHYIVRAPHDRFYLWGVRGNEFYGLSKDDQKMPCDDTQFVAAVRAIEKKLKSIVLGK